MRPRDGAHHTTAVRAADLLRIDALERTRTPQEAQDAGSRIRNEGALVQGGAQRRVSAGVLRERLRLPG